MTAWPGSPGFATTHVDAATDDPSQARADIKLLMDDATAMINSYGDADGVCPLDGSALVSTSNLPTIPVINGGTGATDAPTARTNLGAQAALGYTPINSAGDEGITGPVFTIDSGATPQAHEFKSSSDVGPVFQMTFIAQDVTPVDADPLAYFSFRGFNSLVVEKEFARLEFEATDVSSGTEDGTIRFKAMKAGTLTEIMSIGGDGVTVTVGDNITMGDDKWIGLGASAGRIVFDDQATDEIEIMGAFVGINTQGPDRRLDVLDASNPQLRLTQADGTQYTDFQTNSSGDLTISPSGEDINLDATNSIALGNLITKSAFYGRNAGNSSATFGGSSATGSGASITMSGPTAATPSQMTFQQGASVRLTMAQTSGEFTAATEWDFTAGIEVDTIQALAGSTVITLANDDATFADVVNVTGEINANGGIDTASADLVLRAAGFTGLTISNVSGQATFDDNVTINGTLAIAGNYTLTQTYNTSGWVTQRRTLTLAGGAIAIQEERIFSLENVSGSQTLATMAVTANTTLSALVTVIANENAGGEAAVYQRRIVYEEDAGLAERVEEVIGTDYETNAAYAISFAPSGSNIVLTVDSSTSTVNWTAVFSITILNKG